MLRSLLCSLCPIVLLGISLVRGIPLEQGGLGGTEFRNNENLILLPRENALRDPESLAFLQTEWMTWAEIKNGIKSLYNGNLAPRVANAVSGNNYYQTKDAVLKAADISAAIYMSEKELTDGSEYQGRHMRGLKEMGLTKVVYFDDPATSVEVVLAQPAGGGRLHDPVFVAFAGTQSTQDIKQDIKIYPKEFSQYSAGKVHAGFYQQFVAARPAYYPKLEALIAQGYDNIIFAGHSLGGSVAELAAADLANKYPVVTVSCITFGAARAGDIDFAANFNQKMGVNPARFVNNNDPVPCLVTGFQHVDHLVQFSSKDKQWYEDTPQSSCLSATAVGDHSLVNYIDQLKNLPDDRQMGCREVWDQSCYWSGCSANFCPTGTKESANNNNRCMLGTNKYCCKSRQVCSQ